MGFWTTGRYKQNAYRIADNFLELRKERRDELANLIEKELEDLIEIATHNTTKGPNVRQS